MRVWMLEYFVSDIADYAFEGLFESLDKIYDYLAETYPKDEFHVDDETAEIVDIWNARQEARFLPEMKRNRLDQAEFRASEQEVK